MTRMRISLVTLGNPKKPTGGYLYHRRLAEAAPQHDAQLSFVSFPERPFPLPALGGSKVISRAGDADVIVIDSIAAAFAAPWLRNLGTPAAGMLHQTPGGIDHGPLRTRSQAWLDRLAYRRLEILLVASESLALELRRLHPDVRVVAPGRDVAAAPDGPAPDLRQGRRVAFLCVGNWIPRKGVIELLDAFAALPEEAATLHLVGDDRAHTSYAAEVRARLAQLGDRVSVHGVVPKERVAALYAAADAFVMPSHREPYGTVYGEAMAAGLPVVGWRAGNLPYLADHEREGLVLDPGDSAGLTHALRRLSEDESLRTSLGRTARRRAEAFPTWDETAAAFFGHLRELAERRPA